MTREFKGAFLSLLGGICWGLSGSMGQYLFQHEGMDSRWLVPIRLFLAGVVMMIWCGAKMKKKVFAPWNRKDAGWLLLYCIGGIACCQFLYFLCIQLSTAGTATILQDLSPVIILGVTCIMQKRKPNGLELLSVVLALAGVFLITMHGHTGGSSIPLSALIAGVGCAFCVMVYNMNFGHLLERYPVSLMQAWAFLLGGILFALVFRIWNIHYVPSAVGYFGIAFVVSVGNVLAFTSYIKGVALIGGNKAILYGFSEPVTAAIVSAVVLKSPFTFADGLGFALIFAMLVLISIAARQTSDSSDKVH